MRAALRRVAPYTAPAALALIVGAMFIAMVVMHTAGHWWGDDWALYIRQAKGLLLGQTDEVAAENLFTYTRSAGAEFSPPIYPWGYPLILALSIPFLGTGVDQLALVSKLSLCVFFVFWFLLARRRIGNIGALVGVVAIGATPVILGWHDLVQSEPSFMAATMIALVAIDTLRSGNRLVAPGARLWPLVALGLLIAFAFEIRREGLALVPALFTAQVALLWAARNQRHGLGRRGWLRLGGRLAMPYVVTLISIQITRWLLPTVIVAQSGGGAGPANVWRDWDKNVQNLIKVAGLQSQYATDPTVLGSITWGTIAVYTWFAMVIIGMVVAVTVKMRRDAFLAAFALAAFVIGCSAKANLPRYFAAAAPIFSLLALTGIAVIVAKISGARWRRLTVPATMIIVMVPLLGSNLNSMENRIDYASAFRRADVIEWGAQHPDAIEMFDAVQSLTEPDDIVAAPKARSMVLEADRWAIQVDDYRPMPDDVDVALLVTERTGRRYTEYAAQPDAWTPVWSNSRFVLFAPTEAANN